MSKRKKPAGRSASPYVKQGKVPYHYPWEARLANGNLRKPANQLAGNKYR